jgi:O-antigen/teichoic acid export membrane protein
LNELRNKSFETLAIQLGSQASAVATSIILARVLGPYGKGVMAYVQTVSALLVTFWSGQSAAISWQYGRLKTPSGAVARAMLRILPIGVVASALIILAFSRLPNQWPLVIVAASLPFSYFSGAILGFFLADRNVRVVNVQSLISQAGFTLALILVFFVARKGLSAALITWVIVAAASALYTAWKARPYFSQDDTGAAKDLVRPQVIFGLKASSSALVWLLNSRIDVFIIMSFLGLRALGIYSVGLGLAELMWQVRSALVTSAFGRICTDPKAEAAALAAKCTRHTFIVSACLGAIIFVIGPPLITLVYGQPFAAAGAVLRVVLLGTVAYASMPFLGTFFTQQLGKPAIMTVLGTVSMVICAAITIATIHKLGIVAGALGTMLSYLAAFALAAYIFVRETGLPLSKLFVFDAADWREYRNLLAAIRSSLTVPLRQLGRKA